MNASKENCQQARKLIFSWQLCDVSADEVQFVDDFLQAAERKLPHETSFKTASQKKLDEAVKEGHGLKMPEEEK